MLKTHCPDCSETSKCEQVLTCPYKHSQPIHNQTKQIWVVFPLHSSKTQTGLDDFSRPSVPAVALLCGPSRLSPSPFFGRLLISEQDHNFLVLFCMLFVPARPNSTDRPCGHTACQDLIKSTPCIGSPITFHLLSPTSGFNQHTCKFFQYHICQGFSSLLIGSVFWVD